MTQQEFNNYCTENSKKITDIMLEAAKVHDEVNQNYDKFPYLYHLSSVVSCATMYGHYVCENDEQVLPMIFGAYFHDSIEDARLTYNDVKKIASKFMDGGWQIYTAAEIVYALTNEKGRTREERANVKYYRGIIETPFAPFIKMCDRYANITYSVNHESRMLDVYRKEWNHFKESIVIDCKDVRFSVPKPLIDEIEKKLSIT